MGKVKFYDMTEGEDGLADLIADILETCERINTKLDKNIATFESCAATLATMNTRGTA